MIAEAYQVRDATGILVAVHERHEQPDGGKSFVWRQPDGTTGLAGLSVQEIPLYGIERLVGKTVVLVEGEKACEALWSVSVPAVATVTGASACPSERVLGELTGKRVFLWPDADPVGRQHMEKVAERLRGIAAAIYWMEPPSDVPKGWDAADAVALDGEIVGSLLEQAAEKVFAETSGEPAEGNAVRFRTAREVAHSVPPVVPWRLEGYIADYALTELAAPIKTGKTEWMMQCVRALLDGSPFLGRVTVPTKVVYLTEQPGASLRAALRRASLLERDDLLIVQWADVAGLSWPHVVDVVVDQCRSVGAGLIVVDTLSRFASIPGSGENDAGAADEAMAPLQRAAALGYSIVVVRHERKGGGEVGEASRGSSAFGGASDILLSLRRAEGNGRRTIRVLRSLSRFDETPDELVIELTDGGYVALGSTVAVAHAETRAAALRVLYKRETDGTQRDREGHRREALDGPGGRAGARGPRVAAQGRQGRARGPVPLVSARETLCHVKERGSGGTLRSDHRSLG
ncbi:MAG: AAA family ATPase [Chloroflexota bacterium]